MEKEQMNHFKGWDDFLFWHVAIIDNELAERFQDFLSKYPFEPGVLYPISQLAQARQEFGALMADYRIKAWGKTRRKADERDYLVQGKVIKRV